MARNLRRLSLWLLAGIALLAVLALLVLAALWWWLDLDDLRAQIEARASSSIGRPVRLTGALRWQLGSQIYIASEGGEIANAQGFGAEPLVRWSGLKLGVAARPLFDSRILIDRITVDGLQLNLQRSAQGAGNWDLQLTGDGRDVAAAAVTLHVDALELTNGQIRFQDDASGASWQLSGLVVNVQLPQDLTAEDRQFRDLDVAGRMAGGPLATGGVRFALRAETLRVSPQLLQLPAFDARWADATLSGAVDAQLGAATAAHGTLALQTPSLRALLATVGVSPPPMADPSALGALQFSANYRFAAGAAALQDLAVKLDDTRLSGTLSLPSLAPLALRFDLDADHLDLDHYLEPDAVQSKPFELPLAALKSLDAKGVLRIQRARVAGAAAKELRIDVE